jgi:hypothetical protein
VNTYQGFVREALEKPTIEQVIQSSLRGAVNFLSTQGNPKGCLSIQGALAVGEEADPIKRWLIRGRKNGESVVRKRFEKAKKAGELGAKVDSAALARNFAALLQGLCVQAVSGARPGSTLAGCGKTPSNAFVERVMANRGRGMVSGLRLEGSSDQDDAHYEDPA